MHECSVHIIVYHDPQENYVGMDVFANYDTALACWTSELQRCRNHFKTCTSAQVVVLSVFIVMKSCKMKLLR